MHLDKNHRLVITEEDLTKTLDELKAEALELTLSACLTEAHAVVQAVNRSFTGHGNN
jgi:hypothetical protein